MKIGDSNVPSEGGVSGGRSLQLYITNTNSVEICRNCMFTSFLSGDVSYLF